MDNPDKAKPKEEKFYDPDFDDEVWNADEPKEEDTELIAENQEGDEFEVIPTPSKEDIESISEENDAWEEV